MSKTDHRLDDIGQEKVNDPATLHKLIEECRELGCHVLTPVQKIDNIAPGHVVSLVMVRIDPEDESLVYRDKRWGTDEVALTHVGLTELWVAAAGRWQMSENVPLGEGSHICRWQAGGAIKEPGGAWIPWTESRTEDYREGSEAVAGWSDGRKKEARLRIWERTESFSKNRVIRKMLGVRQKYTKAQLRNPFIVIRTVFQADPSHPIDRVALVADSLGASQALYESSAFKGLLERVADNMTLGEGRSRDVAKLPERATPHAPDKPDNGQRPEPEADAAESPREDAILDFDNSDAKDQVRTLNQMMKELDFDPKGLRKTTSKFTADERRQFFIKLLDMKPEPSQEGLPWE